MSHYSWTILLMFDSLLKVNLILFNSSCSAIGFVIGQEIMEKITKYNVMFLYDNMIYFLLLFIFYWLLCKSLFFVFIQRIWLNVSIRYVLLPTFIELNVLFISTQKKYLNFNKYFFYWLKINFIRNVYLLNIYAEFLCYNI